ncbi:uncharacterized protein I303_108346 [Kwoniella dejecticola CBS 10117]|uniref:Uncharacterized protein n=1 Tax=Kwoniella dejecticola CBS 10117 TaxID=1296121 RepID=A0A1A5ZXM5_9TREE|nr:uncharacterized protein I303_07327 [Kwoniella dejecticola CBS 10117]OBR82566.1 hypothetical protein I303_07327 [Kwoniella dejecticola CBS 10117]
MPFIEDERTDTSTNGTGSNVSHAEPTFTSSSTQTTSEAASAPDSRGTAIGETATGRDPHEISSRLTPSDMAVRYYRGGNMGLQ